MGKANYEHIRMEHRLVIESGLNEREPLASIARRIGFSTSSVQREIVRNRRCDHASWSKNKDKNDCALLKTCKVRGLCGDGCEKRLCRVCTWHCETVCEQYAPRTCETVARAPFVCNACHRYAYCTLERYKYSAEFADGSAKSRASESRAGVDLTREEMDALVETVRDGIAKGQSIHHIFESNAMPVTERSFYRYVEDEKVPVLSIELARKVKYKKRKRVKTDSHESGFYAGREYGDFLALSDEERARASEMGTVAGRRGSRKCILTVHRRDLHFQAHLLLPAKCKDDVVAALDWLEECCGGVEGFRAAFGVIVADRGSEFDDIEGIERSAAAPGEKRCAAYFADPSRPDQKGACEKNHVELRKLLPKGTSFDAMSAYELSEISSHVNSTIRKGCGNATPLALARLALPQGLLDNLGLRDIPAKEVIAIPGVLYKDGE